METLEAVVVPKAEREALAVEVRETGLIEVVDAATYQAAGERWKALVALEKKIEAKFARSVETTKAAYDEARALRDEFLTPVTAAKKAQPERMKVWAREEERKRVELERKAQAEAKKKADDEALAAAAALEKDGFKEAAAEIINTPPPAPVVVQPRTVPKGMGAAIRTTWKARVVDVKALVAAVASGAVPMAAIIPNEVFLGQQARALKAECKYPGVQVFEE